jgi:hypothetical protein
MQPVLPRGLDASTPARAHPKPAAPRAAPQARHSALSAHAAHASAAMATALSLKCNTCGLALRSMREAQDHGEATGHADFSESTEAVLSLVCAECGKPCRSQTECDVHTKRTGHAEFVDKTAEAAKPVVRSGCAARAAAQRAILGLAARSASRSALCRPSRTLMPRIQDTEAQMRQLRAEEAGLAAPGVPGQTRLLAAVKSSRALRRSRRRRHADGRGRRLRRA